MILLDFSQVAIVALTANMYGAKDNEPIDIGYARSLIVNTIRSYNSRFKREYGQMVLCCDDQSYWRKKFFSGYKYSRPSARQKSTLDWDSIKSSLSTVSAEIKEHFPYPVIQVAGAEGDDVIAALTMWSRNNDLNHAGIFPAPQPIMIVSSDGDFVQLQKYPDIKQYSPNLKKLLTAPKGMTPAMFLNEHIAEGDPTDSVMNVLSADNVFIDKIRQKSLMQKRREEFIQHGIEACINEDERKNYERNRVLIDFDCIPAEITNAIIAEYLEQKVTCQQRGHRKLLPYFIANKMGVMMEYLDEF